MDAKISYCIAETHKHVRRVQHFLNIFVQALIHRGENHDNSKFEEPELSVFAEQTPLLSRVKYGSEEYKDLLDKVKPAIDHHYSKNRHHVEHFPNGIEDMTLIDLLEMISDWRAATERNKDGNIRKSVEINGQKYNIHPQLRKIIENTIKEYFNE